MCVALVEVGLHVGAAAIGERCGQGGVGEQAHGSTHGLRIIGRDEQPRLTVDDDVGDAADAGGDDRGAVREGLHEHERRDLAAAGDEQDIGREHVRGDILARPQPVETPGDAKLDGGRAHHGGECRIGFGADERQGGVEAAGDELGQSADGYVVALVGVDAGHHQQPRRRAGAVVGPPRSIRREPNADRVDDHVRARVLQLAHDRGRDRHHGVGHRGVQFQQGAGALQRRTLLDLNEHWHPGQARWRTGDTRMLLLVSTAATRWRRTSRARRNASGSARADCSAHRGAVAPHTGILIGARTSSPSSAKAGRKGPWPTATTRS